MRPWTTDLLVVVYIKTQMCAVTDKFKFKTKFLYLWSSGMGIRLTILNDFPSWSFSDPAFLLEIFLIDSAGLSRGDSLYFLWFCCKTQLWLVGQSATVVGLVIKETRNEVYFDFQNFTEYTEGYHNPPHWENARAAFSSWWAKVIIKRLQALENNSVR